LRKPKHTLVGIPVFVRNPPSLPLAKAKYERKARECPSTRINVGEVVVKESEANWFFGVVWDINLF
jgi:hypothetical protein